MALPAPPAPTGLDSEERRSGACSVQGNPINRGLLESQKALISNYARF